MRRELIIAVLGGLTGALPARSQSKSKKMSQIAAAYQNAKRLVQLSRLLVLHPTAELRGCERRYQPDRVVQALLLPA
jgi:hypothetical protein